MTKGQIIFCIYIAIWLLIGNIGMLNAKKNRIAWEMIIFMLLALTIPCIAKFCKLV